MKTPEQIAEQFVAREIRFGDTSEVGLTRLYVEGLISRAIEADRAQRSVTVMRTRALPQNLDAIIRTARTGMAFERQGVEWEQGRGWWVMMGSPRHFTELEVQDIVEQVGGFVVLFEGEA